MIFDLSSIVEDNKIPSVQFNNVPMDEEGFLILNASQVVHSKTYDQDSLKNLNPKEIFSWLYQEGEKNPSLNKHTLKIEVYSSIT